MRYAITFVISILLAWSSAVAQTTDSTANKELARVGTPSPRSSLGFANIFQFNVASTESTASIKLSKDLSNQGNSGQLIAFIASAPVNKGSSTFASLDGLASGTTLEVRTENWKLSGIGIEKSADALTWCKAVNLEQKYKELNKSLEGYECDIQTAESLKNKGIIDAPTLESFRRLFFRENAAITSWGLSARFGYQDIDYYDIVNLSKQNTREGVWSVGLFSSMFRPVQGSIFSGSLTLERVAGHRDQEIRCQTPTSNTTLLSCVNGIIGSPGHKTTTVAGIEYRQRTVANLALALQLSRDIRNHITTAQLPVYFVQSNKQGLTGGINIGWNSQDRKTVAGIFVGQAFSWFGSK